MPKNPLVDQPAIVQAAEKEEAWDVEVKAAKGFAKRSAQAVAFAGAKLLLAKTKCPHGQWLPTLRRHGVSRRTASFWIESFKRYRQMGDHAHLDELLNSLGDMYGTEDGEIPARDVGEEPEYHPSLAVIQCKDCLRKGPRKDCPACLGLRRKFLGLDKRAGGSKKSKKAGKSRYDWQTLTTHARHLYVMPDKLAKAYPEAKSLPEYKRTSALLDDVADSIEALKKKITE